MAKRISQLTALNTPEGNDQLPIVDTSAGQTKKVTLAAILGAIYPVGSVYTNAGVSTSPATLLGFGTWERFGNGRVLVGVDEAQTEFDTIGDTGGEKTHQLTVNEMPSHFHERGSSSGQGSSTARLSRGTGANDGNVRTADPAGGDQPHNNLQPYITVYMWKRIA